MSNSPVSGSNRAKTRFMPGVTSEHRGRASVSREDLIAHMLIVVTQLGYFPAKGEYEKLHGNKVGSTVYRYMGHAALADACGYHFVKVADPSHPRRYQCRYIRNTEHATLYHARTKTLPFECFNGTYCVGRPIHRVKQKFEYCEPCKKDRGWYD